MAEVSLREITKDTARAVMKLEVAPDQNDFVAPNSWSIAQAHFEPKAWFRAIYADDDPVGFIMLFDDADKPEYFLWRLMVAADHQAKGYGRRAVELLIDYVRSRPGATELLTSFVPGERGPEQFYRSFGFVDTGEIDDGEVVIRLTL